MRYLSFKLENYFSMTLYSDETVIVPAVYDKVAAMYLCHVL
jgi:hypothetical protein